MNRFGDSLICWGDNERLIKALANFQVNYILIGGLAISWYCNTRQADDMDILINPTSENSVKLFTALESLGLNVGFDQTSFSKNNVLVKLRDEFYVDIITPARGSLTFDEISHNSISAKLFNIAILIPSISTLIKMKEYAIQADQANVDKHLRDIELLNKITAL